MSTNLNYEVNRLKTFNANWPHAFIIPRILAKIGFYYIGPHDQVKCHFCEALVSSWEMGDNEVTEHRRWSPNCPLVNQNNTLNVPLEPTFELDELLRKLQPANYNIRYRYGNVVFNETINTCNISR